MNKPTTPPSDLAALQAENARLRKLVESAYREGWGDAAWRDELSAPDDMWRASDACAELDTAPR